MENPVFPAWRHSQQHRGKQTCCGMSSSGDPLLGRQITDRPEPVKRRKGTSYKDSNWKEKLLVRKDLEKATYSGT